MLEILMLLKKDIDFLIIGFKKQVNFNKFKWPVPKTQKLILKDILLDVPKLKEAKYPKSKEKILKMVPASGSWVNLPENVAKQYMQKSYYLGGGKRGIARRLSWDEPSLTLTTSPMQKQTERCHPEEIRPFNIREYARIQSFPDNWKFYGSVSSQYRQIGNAVPVNLAKAVGESILKALI